MTKLLDEALASARRLPPAMQDDLAGGEQPPVALEPEEDEALARR